MANLTESLSLAEAAKALTGKTWKIRIIEGDRQGSSAYYPKEVLESGKHLFAKGTRIFRNHPSMDEKWNQPERKVEDIIGWLSEDATFDGKDLYASATFVESEQQRIKELAEAGVIGMSIRAQGEMTEGKNGMELKKFTAVQSVDVVTVAGAGGEFTQVLESAGSEKAASESVAESTKEEEITMEFPKELAEALDALVQTSKKNTEDIAALVEASKPKPEEPEAFKFAEAVLALDEAELPKASRARVLAVIEAQGDYAAAIETEKALVEELRESLKSEGFQANGEQEVTESTKDSDYSGIFGD